MRVLPAILSDAGYISLDVAGLQRCAVERRCQKQDDAIRAAHEVFVDSRHGARCASRIASPRDDAPRLRDRIDAAYVVAGSAERRPIVEVCAAIPVAVPALAFERFLERAHMPTPPLGALTLPACVSQVSPFG